MKVPLLSGAYQARSLIASAQECINLFPEINPEDIEPPAPMTHYPRPGLRPLGAPPEPARGRGIFTASNGELYAVCGQVVYLVTTSWEFVRLGELIAPASTPVSMVDNGTTAVIVDGSQQGYQIPFISHSMSQIADPTGLFRGATRVDYADTFLTFNKPGTNQWFISLSGQVAFNALNLAAKSSYPDPIATQIVNLRQVWLLGTKTSEVWYLSGEVNFPYSAWPNVSIPYGCVAPYSAARADINVFWISANDQGKAIVVQNEGYGAKAISTRAIENEINGYRTVSDAIGYTYQQGGHTFYVISFPTADKTWAYDLATKQWHRRAWLDNNGVMRRDRVAFAAYVSDRNGYQNTNVGQDWATGQIYAMDPNVFTDNAQPIVFLRSFPHIVNELKELTVGAFVADIETGTIEGTGSVNQVQSPWSSGFSSGFGPVATVEAPVVNLRVSKDGGNTWGNYRRKGFVSSGKYRSMQRWRQLGMGRDFVFELSWSYPGKSALNGAFVDPIPHAA